MHEFPRVLKSGVGFWCLLFALWMGGCDKGSVPPNDPMPGQGTQAEGIDSALELVLTPDAFVDSLHRTNTSNVQVLVRGVATRLLADDLEGDKHQRFILRLRSGQTLLVAHNIDLAGRVPASALNKTVYVHGEYEWNAEGGVVHWTHKDPDNVHPAGWIQYDGDKYW